MSEEALQKIIKAEERRCRKGSAGEPVGRLVFNSVELPRESLIGTFFIRVLEILPHRQTPERVNLELSDDDTWWPFIRLIDAKLIAGEGVQVHHRRLSLHSLIDLAKRVKEELSYQYFQA